MNPADTKRGDILYVRYHDEFAMVARVEEHLRGETMVTVLARSDENVYEHAFLSHVCTGRRVIRHVSEEELPLLLLQYVAL